MVGLINKLYSAEFKAPMFGSTEIQFKTFVPLCNGCTTILLWECDRNDKKTKYKHEKTSFYSTQTFKGFGWTENRTGSLGRMQNPGLKAEKGDENLLHTRNEISEKNSVNWKETFENLKRNTWC